MVELIVSWGGIDPRQCVDRVALSGDIDSGLAERQARVGRENEDEDEDEDEKEKETENERTRSLGVVGDMATRGRSYHAF